MSIEISIPNQPILPKEKVPIQQTAVERSIAKPDAFMKPCSVGKPAARTGRGTPETRIRMTNPNPKQRKKKRDPRDVRFY
jgi:hypothetical protein